MAAGYFCGYSAKMQPVGQKELKAMRETLVRKIQEDKDDKTSVKRFGEYARRLVRDLEGKGTIRTSLETTNLAVNVSESDNLRAECIRTFPTFFSGPFTPQTGKIETGLLKNISFCN